MRSAVAILALSVLANAGAGPPLRAPGFGGPTASAALPRFPRRGQGQLLDSIAAVVDGHAVTQSQVEDVAWLARLSQSLDGQAAAVSGPLTAAESADALQHAVDAAVVDEACANEGCDPAPGEEVEAQWQHLTQLAGGAAALRQRLAAGHLDETTVRGLLRGQLTMLAFIDDHVANSIVIGDPEVETYYNSQFVPRARAQGMTPAPLNAVRAEIEAILRQQQLGTAEAQFVARLRREAKIVVRGNIGAGPSAATPRAPRSTPGGQA